MSDNDENVVRGKRMVKLEDAHSFAPDLGQVVIELLDEMSLEVKTINESVDKPFYWTCARYLEDPLPLKETSWITDLPPILPPPTCQPTVWGTELRAYESV